jgi:hypothetical protein
MRGSLGGDKFLLQRDDFPFATVTIVGSINERQQLRRAIDPFVRKKTISPSRPQHILFVF